MDDQGLRLHEKLIIQNGIKGAGITDFLGL